jgi:multicomponent K+:H+ antiporter subunit D
MPHLIVVPIVLPMVAAALMLLLGQQRRAAQALVGLVACALNLAVAVLLLAWVDRSGVPGAVGVYLPANWDVPFGIVLAIDRLSALMLVLTGVTGLASALFALARWHRAGVHFHPLFQVQLMGLNGAFLTADLFNLFVFFEVMLAASYGLVLHGTGRARVRAGLHYIAVNLLASSLFLVGVAILYGITGTLNMADMAQKIPEVPPDDRALLHAGAAILGIAFLVKAAMWPLNFWLVPAYAAASAPVAALFVILTKVGVYSLLRLWTLLLGPGAAASAQYGGTALLVGGMATLAFGAVGMLASHQLRRLAGFSVIVSSGTLLAVIGGGETALIGGALYYLLGSTIAGSALFLVAELVERSRQAHDADVALRDDGIEAPPFQVGSAVDLRDGNLDDSEAVLIGQAIPAAMAFLGLSFVACAALVAGLPPLSGFLAKFAMLAALLGQSDAPIPASSWLLTILLIGSGLLSTIALSRAGIRYFWAPQQRPAPRLRVIECLPIAALLIAGAALTIGAGPTLRYANAAASGLLAPERYIEAVFSAMPVPGAARPGVAPGGAP